MLLNIDNELPIIGRQEIKEAREICVIFAH
jgi:hypothetical protein